MAHKWIAFVATTVLAGSYAEARPVSYEGGWTLIQESNRQDTSLWVHYTLNPRLSLGARSEWNRQQDFVFNGAQATYLVNRWFGENHQGNLYAIGGLGAATGVGANPAGTQFSGFIGALADFETRRWFTSYQVRYLGAGDVGGGYFQAARIGWAPYEGDTGDLHTWLMLEVDHRPNNPNEVGVTPMLRFFKGTALLEVGWSVTDNQPLVNFTYRF